MNTNRILVGMLFLVCASAALHGQTAVVDTLFYDRDGHGCDKVFASYYRVYSVPEDSCGARRFRDYFPSGKLKAEGCYASINSTDDSRSVFDGKFVSYYESGKVREMSFWKDGALEGDYTEYMENGLVRVHAGYCGGELCGVCTEFSDDGDICYQTEYAGGRPLHDYYIMTTRDGLYCKKLLASDEPVYDSPSADEMQTEYNNGEKWSFYVKNGFMVSMAVKKVRECGRYYQLCIVLANNSMTPVDFGHDNITAMVADNNWTVEQLKVYSSDEYMRRVRRRQNALVALVAIGEGLSAGAAGYAGSTTVTDYAGVTYRNGMETSATYGTSVVTTSSYDALAAFQAQVIASERIADFTSAMIADREVKDAGYLKLTTVYPGETVSGYINVEYRKGDNVWVIVNICGAEYEFPLKLDK